MKFGMRFFRTKKFTFTNARYHNYNTFIQHLGFFGVIISFKTPWSHDHA